MLSFVIEEPFFGGVIIEWVVSVGEFEQVFAIAIQALKDDRRVYYRPITAPEEKDGNLSAAIAVEQVLKAAERAALGINAYASVHWTAEDLMDNFACTQEQAEDWLWNEGDGLLDYVIEKAWNYIHQQL